MRLLLDAWRIVTPDGTQRLTLVHIDGRTETIDAPFLPYVYMRGTEEDVEERLRELGIGDVVSVRQEDCVALSDLEAGPEPWCKIEFQNVNGVSRLNDTVTYESTARAAQEWRAVIPRDDGGYDPSPPPIVLAENHLAFIERVLADKPGWLNDHATHGPSDVTRMWLDIEQSHPPLRFPDENDPIISIAYEVDGPGAEKLGDRAIGEIYLTPEEMTLETHQPGLGKRKLWDKRIIKEFAEIWALADPAVVAGYNLHGYDLPMLSKRSARVGISPNWMCRTGRPRFTREKVGMWEKERTVLGGRVVFDVFERVWIDQSLNGKVKDRGLKTVARYRGLHVIKEDTENILEIFRKDPRRVVEYNRNDVVLTKSLGESYWQNVIGQADMTQAPLRLVVDGSANFFGTRFSAEDFRASPAPFHKGHRVLSDGTNGRRFSHLKAKAPNGVIVTGAKVGIKKTGRFGPKACANHKLVGISAECDACQTGTTKVDVGAMYPSNAETFGLSPDNTVHVGVTEYGPFFARILPGSPVPRGVDAWREYHIPDAEWQVNHIIRVYGNGRMAQRIKEMRTKRKAVKKKMEAIEEKLGKAEGRNTFEWKTLDGQQQTLKQWMNSVPYGNQANEYSRYGTYPVAMTITGVGRLVASIIEEYLEDAAIETDTDGVYSDALLDVNAVNKAITDFVKTRCLLDENTIKVELDEYHQSYFHSMKNYVLLTKEGDIIKHGSALIGTKHCELWDEAVERAAKEVFGLAPVGSFVEWRLGVEADLKAGKIALDRLVQRQKCRKTTQYPTNTQGRQIAASHVAVYGREPHPDSQIAFVKTKGGFEVAGAPGVERRVEVAHYAEDLKTVQDFFRLGKQLKVMTLADFA